MYRDPSWLDLLLVLFFVAVTAASMVKGRLESEPDPIERAREAYAAGEIDETEFARRVEFRLDDRNAQIRAVVEDVPDIGDDRSEAIAREYDSLEELRETDRERLESVPDIGEQRAENVLERVRE